MTITDPLSGRPVRVDAWGRYLECRFCGDSLEHTRGRAGRPLMSCYSDWCILAERDARNRVKRDRRARGQAA